MVRFGVIGYGYWGPNIVRNLISTKDASVKWVCDLDAGALKKVRSLYPGIEVAQDHRKLLMSVDIDAVAIVTPVSSHFQLAKDALNAGKHVFIEKPFTSSSREAKELVSLARKKRLKIMVDHTFIFTGAVKKIKESIDRNILGKLNYYDSTRVSLGLFQHDVNVIWDLAVHDFAILDYIVKNKPLALTAHGADHLSRGQANLAYITMYYEQKLLVHINVNWLSPVKVRTIMIAGDKKMLVWDDLRADEKIKVYDRGVRVKDKEGIYKLLVDYRSGDMYSPRIDHQEALRVELEYFVKCIKSGQDPVNNGESGLRVVKLLELADRSLKDRGKLIKVR